MKLLLVEDDANKRKQISEYLKTAFSQIEIEEKGSYQSGVEAMMQGAFDFLLLDMSLPTYDVGPNEDGFEFDGFAGREILAELKRHNICLKAVVVTQFETFGEGDDIITLDELDRQMKQQFGGVYLGAVYYSASHTEWKRALLENITSA